MELSKKTTVLFSPELHERLSRLAAQKGISLGELVRQACEAQYEPISGRDRLEAVRLLATLELPVGSAKAMKDQSVPTAAEILP